MLDEDGDPVAVGPRFPRLSAGDWHRIGAALRDPEAAGPPGGVLTRWVAAIARRLALDPTETALLSLALHYRIDARMERLFDLLSRARGAAARLRGDPALIGLLLGAAPEAIARCLTGTGRLFASGLLRLAPDGELGVFNRLVELARNGVPPAAEVVSPDVV